MREEITLPKAVKNIIKEIEAHGHEAYAVGGCVRDSVLGREPNDWDVTTSAKPEEIKSYFKKTIDTGIEHGTVTVRMYGESYEVTTYRIDGIYEDARHPKDVTFTEELKEDLMRRDFTVNAMAYHPERGFVDIFGGREDLVAGVIRCVGDPMERFAEDALRMLRAIRFAAELGFTVDDATYAAIGQLSESLQKISMERIRTELVKIITSDNPWRLRDVYICGLSASFLPELDALFETEQNSVYHCYDVGEHTIEVMKALPADKTLRLAGLFHDIGKPVVKKTDKKGQDHFVGHPQVGADMTRAIMRRLTFDNATRDAVVRLVRYHDERPLPTKRNIRRLAARAGADAMPLLFALKEADIAGQSDYRREEKLADLAQMKKLFSELIEEDACVKLADLAINGKDLIEENIPKGRRIGEILNHLLKEVVDDPEKNKRAYLTARAKELYQDINRRRVP